MRELAVLQVGITSAAALWLLIGNPVRRPDLWFRIASVWLLFAGVGFAGVWLAAPLSLVPFLAILTAAASIVAARRIAPPEVKASPRKLWVSRLLASSLLALGMWLAAPAIAGWLKPELTVDLRFPFDEGRYLIANGGASERINGHFMTLRPTFAKWRGQSYAVDLIRVDHLGFRTRQPGIFNLPRQPHSYLTYGTRVVAPCSGMVEEAVSHLPDMPVAMRDRQHLEGNFVRLRCGQVVVLLAHFKNNGIVVHRGDRVTPGQHLGYAGNSGNTAEPHLHIHAQTPGTAGAPMSGSPLPISFEGRFLVRNMIVGSKRR